MIATGSCRLICHTDDSWEEKIHMLDFVTETKIGQSSDAYKIAIRRRI